MAGLLELNIRRTSKELSSLAQLIGKSSDSRNKYHGLLEIFNEIFKLIDDSSVNGVLLKEAAIQLLEKAQRLNDSGENLDIKQMSTQFATRLKGLKLEEVIPFVSALKKANIESFIELLKLEFPPVQKADAAGDIAMLLLDIRRSTKELTSLASLIGASSESRKKYHGLLEAFGCVFEQLYAPSVNINNLSSLAEQLLEKAHRLNDSGVNLEVKRQTTQFATRLRSLKACEVREFVIALKNADIKAFTDLLTEELEIFLGIDPSEAARKRREAEKTTESKPEVCIPKIVAVDFRDSSKENDTYGTILLSTIHYLSPRVKYSMPYTPKSPVKLSYRIFSPAGEMEKSESKPDGFLASELLTSREGMIVFDSWGNSKGTAYSEGRWRFEIYCDSILIHTAFFDIKSPFSHQPPSIDIQRVDFANVNIDGKVLDYFGSDLPVNTQYLKPRLFFTARNPENWIVNIRYIIYDSNGVPFKNSARNDRYTSSTEFNLAWFSPATLNGFGNSEGSCYRPGTYKMEIYEGDYLLYTTYARIGKVDEPSPQQMPITSPQDSSLGSSSSKEKSESGGCWPTIIITAIVLAIVFGVMKWCTREDSKDAIEDVYKYVMASQVFLRSSPSSASNANIITKYPYGTRLSYIGQVENWLEVKDPESGKTGFVSQDYVLSSSDFNHLDSIWGSRDIIDYIPMTRHRQALLDLYKEMKSKMVDSYFILHGPNENWIEKNVKDGYDAYPEFAFIVKDALTGNRKTVIYSFLPNESPLLRHIEDAPVVGGIRDLSYRSGSGFIITYGSQGAKSKKSKKTTSYK